MAPSRVPEPNASPRPPANPAAPAQAGRLLAELVALLDSALTPAEFFDSYLGRVLEATGAAAVCLWEADGKGGLRPLHSRGPLPADPQAVRSDQARLQEVARRGRAVWLTGDEGPSSHARLVAPVFEEQSVVGLLEIVMTAPEDRGERRGLTRLATELAAFAAAFLHRLKWQRLQQQKALWEDLEAFVAGVHGSLDPAEVSALVANAGKKLLGCHQCAVGLRAGRRTRVASVSGATSVDRRGPLVAAMETLFDRVAAWGEVLIYDGARDEGLPPDVGAALDEYLALSSGAALIVLPLREPGDDGRVCGLLAGECFDRSQELSGIRARAEQLARHVAPALANALRHDRLPFRRATGLLADLREGGTSLWTSRWAAAGLGLLVVAAALALFRLPLRAEASGQLVPRERRVVYAPMNGKVLQLAAQHGDRVDKGQELLFIEDVDTQLKVDQLFVKIGSLNQKLAFLDDQLGKEMSAKERNDTLAARIQAQYELQKARVERNLLLADVRNPRKAPVVAPLAGQVLTFDAREKLVGKTVKVGEPLLRIADVGAAWEVELLIPERAVGRVRDALLRSPDGTVPVQLLLSSDPQRAYLGTLTLTSLGGETTLRDDRVVLPARVEITDKALTGRLERMPVGVEVRARLACGDAAAGYVWFSEVWDFLYERFLF